MVELTQEIDWQSAEDMPDFELIPNGKYMLEITGSVPKATKAGDGEYITFTIKILEGEFEKRLIFKNVNIKNKSEKAQNFGLSTLRSMCEAIGLQEKLKDTGQMHGIPFIGDVYTAPATGGYSAKNDIRTFHKIGDMVPTPTSERRSDTPSPVKKTTLSTRLDDDIPF